MRLLCALAVAAAVALLLPATSVSKVVCGERAGPFDLIELDGLPELPVAQHVYTVTTIMPSTRAVNSAPYLGAEYCGESRAAGPPPAGPSGWFRRSGRGRYTIEVSFPRAGDWQVAFMDRTGRFHDVRMGPVREPEVPPWRIAFRGWWLPVVTG